MKIGIYCRVSSEDQRDNTSLVVQKESGIKFCKDNGFEYEVFSEVENPLIFFCGSRNILNMAVQKVWVSIDFQNSFVKKRLVN